MRIPPPEFVRDLTAYDPELRCRWGMHTSLWFIEKKLEGRLLEIVQGHPNPKRSKRGLDLYEGWRAGYGNVLIVHPELLNWPFVQEHLVGVDHYKDARWQDMNRRLDALAEQRERAEDRQIGNWIENATDEAYDALQWRLGTRVAVRTPPEPAYEPRDGYRVRDRRVKVDA